MGSRCNFVIAHKSTRDAKTLDEVLAQDPIVLYSHWGGGQAGADLAAALKKAKPRWDDEGYGARILVSQIIGSGWDSETGYGLYVGELVDNSYPVPVIDFAEKVVRIPERRSGKSEWTFAEFAALTPDQATAAIKGED
jgi:hypothetical protein